MKKAKKKLITQKQAAEEICVTERQVRRLLRKLRRIGDRVVIHELWGRPRIGDWRPSWNSERSQFCPTRFTGDLARRAAE
jgi:transcription initiation factor IIE alpha subunit